MKKRIKEPGIKQRGIKKEIEFTKSSGNIFEDLGFPDAKEKLAKVDLAIKINELIDQKDLTQVEAAKLLDIDQPKISALSTGRLSGFSLERLFRFLNILDQDITINITPKIKSKKKAEINISIPKSRKKAIIKPRSSTPTTARIQARKKK